LYWDAPNQILFVTDPAGVFKFNWNGTHSSYIGLVGASGTSSGKKKKNQNILLLLLFFEIY